ncbi:uncharacterized protein [Dermacentor andersoni]|uniref:uncharacterized protein n=1 Tax=Dermacentor andersoni TaxID=34620 RepID=UPI003B3BB2F0
MEPLTTTDAALEYATRIKRICPDLPDTALLAAELLRAQTTYTRTVFPLPIACTASTNTMCSLLDVLLVFNELLHVIAVEITEVEFGKVAVRVSEDLPLGMDQQEKMRAAVIFLHCLLTQHRCVKRLEFVLPPRRQYFHEPILCDALGSLSSVSSLHLRRCSFSANDTAKVFAAIDRLLLSQLVDLSLQLLEIDASASTTLGNFMEGLKKTTTLKSLEVLGVRLNTEVEECASIFREKTLCALSANTSVTSLVVDAMSCAGTEDTSLKTLLKNPAIPAELTVICHKHNQRRKCYLVFDAMATNKTVTKVRIENFNLCSKDAESLVLMLCANDTIKELCLVKSTWTIRTRNVGMYPSDIRPHAQHLAYGLTKTKSLQRLAVRCEFSADEIRCILKAADKCESLQELHFPSLESHNCRQIYDALKHTGVMSKLTIEQLRLEVDSQLAEMVTFFSKVLADDYRCDPLNLVHARLGHSCEPLGTSCGDHLRVLYLTYNTENVLPSIPLGIKAYLALTKSLEHLHMDFTATSEMADFIISGIVSNDSIKELRIFKFSVSSLSLAVLCRWLEANRLLHSLEMHLSNVFGGLLVAGLEKVLGYNYTLTSLDVHESDHSLITLLIRNLVTRNNTFLKRAAAYVLGSLQKTAALAYKEMSRHPQLKAEVQRIASISEGEADQKILNAENRRRALERTNTDSSMP